MFTDTVNGCADFLIYFFTAQEDASINKAIKLLKPPWIPVPFNFAPSYHRTWVGGSLTGLVYFGGIPNMYMMISKETPSGRTTH